MFGHHTTCPYKIQDSTGRRIGSINGGTDIRLYSLTYTNAEMPVMRSPITSL
jgi:hypothetical protein